MENNRAILPYVKLCTFPGCIRKHLAIGYCSLHWQRRKAGVLYGKKVKPIRLCQVPECNGKHDSRGYCGRHYMQMKVYGKIINLSSDRPHIDCGEFVKIPLGKMAKGGYFLLDKEDAWLDKYKWTLTTSGYPRSNLGNDLRVRIHHLIIGQPLKGLVVDHINGDPLDNRKCNLRVVTIKCNSRNQKLFKNSTTKVRGVRERDGRYQAYITADYKQINLGRYDTLHEASEARRKGEIKYWGNATHR